MGDVRGRDVRGKVGAITGAASGIGEALAVELARRGADLALCDVDEEGLATTAARCRREGATVTTRRVDVARRDEVHDWADAVVDEHARVDLVVNNAGVALMSTVEATSYDDLEWLVGIDLWGVIHGTKAFLPHLLAADAGHIVNISSVFGLLSIPGQSAYNVAKFGVRGFTDALRMELEIAGSGVSCTTVHPGGIRTNIAANARIHESVAQGRGAEEARRGFDRIARTSPEKAARQILLAVERNRRRTLVGPDAKALDLLARLPIGLYQRVLVAGARRSERTGGPSAEAHAVGRPVRRAAP